MEKLQEIEFRYVISWSNLKKIGIDLSILRSEGVASLSDSAVNKIDETWKSILKENMPEMLRLEGYDPCGTPRLTTDYFFQYILAVFNSSTGKDKKPHGRYLFTKDRYRVLVDEQNLPIDPNKPELYGIDERGKKYVSKVYGL